MHTQISNIQAPGWFSPLQTGTRTVYTLTDIADKIFTESPHTTNEIILLRNHSTNVCLSSYFRNKDRPRKTKENAYRSLKISETTG